MLLLFVARQKSSFLPTISRSDFRFIQEGQLWKNLMLKNVTKGIG